MSTADAAVVDVLQHQKASGKPLAVIVAGHNGSGKSTWWNRRLAPSVRIPLVNADRMMLSILPEILPEHYVLPEWARRLRDEDASWMRVAQKGVQSFVDHAMEEKAPFAMETVFSHLVEENGRVVASKVDLIRRMQRHGYFVLLLFVGLQSASLSVARVMSRVALGGHDVPRDRLMERFPRTQRAIALAKDVADACVFVDNSRDFEQAFTLCHVRVASRVEYDARGMGKTPPEIVAWLPLVADEV